MDSGSFFDESGFTGSYWLAGEGDGEFWVFGLYETGRVESDYVGPG